MAIVYFGPSRRLTVTDAGVSATLPRDANQCRLFNSGDNPCRVSFDGAASDTDPILPPGGWETRTKYNSTAIYAKCDTGLTTTLDAIGCSGD